MGELEKTQQPSLHPDGSCKNKTATAGLSNIAATVANLAGLEKHAKWNESLLMVK